jgi:hypothetical protein
MPKKSNFEKMVKQIMDALDVFQKTGQRNQFVAVQDQIKTFEKERNQDKKST